MDSRSFDDILAELRGNAQRHIPSWDPENESDPGIMLQHTFGRLMEIVIERLNRVPEKQKLAFLDAMNISPLPPVPARAPIVFALRKDASFLSLPPGTAINAKVAGGGPQVVFETIEELVVLPMAITCAYALEPNRNRYGEYTDRLGGKGFTPFVGEHNIPDAYYCIEDIVLPLKQSRFVYLTLNLAQPATGARIKSIFNDAIWSYSNGVDGITFSPRFVECSAGVLTYVDENTPASDLSDSKSYNSFRCLLGPSVAVLPSDQLGGGREPLAGHYIKCAFNNSFKIKDMADNLIISSANVYAASYERIPDHIYSQSARLNPDSAFLPFGSQTKEGGSFFIHVGELLDIQSAEIIIQMILGANYGLWNGLRWYYSTQEGWKEIENAGKNTVISVVGATAHLSLKVSCQPDIAPRKINGINGRWLRAVLAPNVAVDKNNESLSITANSISLSMWCHMPCRSYRQQGHIYTPLGQPLPTVTTHPELEKTAFYLGFNHFCMQQPVSLYADAEAMADDPVILKDVKPVWEYLSSDGWNAIYVTDDTAGLSRSGMVRFLAPTDAIFTELFDNTARYWVRVTQQNSRRRLNGIYLNAVVAEHAITVKRDVLGISNGYANQRFTLRDAPVLIGQHIWVHESEAPTAAELPETSVEIRQNPVTLEQENWVLWREQNSFGASQPSSRHYTLDRTNGEIVFGNGIRGMVPEKGATIVANYRFGGGTRGNLPERAIAKLSAVIPEIECVYNPIPSTGGAQSEDMHSLLNRGPMVLRHRMRGVTVQDIEWLVKEIAGAAVDRVKCLPGDMQCPFTLILLPATESDRPLPDGALSTRIRDYLNERIPTALSNTSFGIVGPRYISVDVSAVLVPSNPFESSLVRERAAEHIKTFLHPRFGGPDGTGWEFGRHVYLSEICAVLESVSGVEHTLASTVSICPAAVQRELTLGVKDARLEEVYPTGSLLSIYGGYGEVVEQWLLAEAITGDVLPRTIRATGVREGDTLNITCALCYNSDKKEFLNTPIIDFPAGSEVIFNNGFRTTLCSDLPMNTQLASAMLGSKSQSFYDKTIVTLVHPDTLEVTGVQDAADGDYVVMAHCMTKDMQLSSGIVLECTQRKVKVEVTNVSSEKRSQVGKLMQDKVRTDAVNSLSERSASDVQSTSDKAKTGRIDNLEDKLTVPYIQDGNTIIMCLKQFRIPSKVVLTRQDGMVDAIEIPIAAAQAITDIAYLSEFELCTPGTIDIQIAQ